MCDKQTGEISYVRKIRGITFDKQNEEVLAYEHFKRMVLSTPTKEDENEVHFNYSRIGPTNKSDVLTKQMQKIYRVVNNKGWTDPTTHVVYPFGFKK